MTESKDPVEVAIEKAKPILANIGFGCVMGYCSGYALKKVGKALAFVIGLGFIGLQGLVYAGYLQIDWMKIHGDIKKSVDTTGDGKFDTEDLKVYWQKVKTILTNKLPSSGGFSFGFLYGVRSG